MLDLFFLNYPKNVQNKINEVCCYRRNSCYLHFAADTCLHETDIIETVAEKALINVTGDTVD